MFGVVATPTGSSSNTNFFFFLSGFASIDNLKSHYILYIDRYLLVTILKNNNTQTKTTEI